MVISEQPLCAEHHRQGLIVPGNEVDHIDNDASNNDRDNLENLCHSCHSRKTNRDRGASKYMGCDVNGTPLNPSHPWRMAENAQKSPEPQATEPTVKPHARNRT